MQVSSPRSALKAADDVLLKRIRAEYLEMPGMALRLEQVARLCGVDRHACKAVLDALVDVNFLRVRPDGMYARVSVDTVHCLVRAVGATRWNRG